VSIAENEQPIRNLEVLRATNEKTLVGGNPAEIYICKREN